MQAKNIVVSSKVDLEREERLRKCDIMVDQFEKVLSAPGLAKALQSQNATIKECAQVLEADAQFFVDKCKSRINL